MLTFLNNYLGFGKFDKYDGVHGRERVNLLSSTKEINWRSSSYDFVMDFSDRNL